MPYMYIVECADTSFYVGSTWDVEKRVWQHNHDGGAAYTRRRQPVRLVYFEEYESIAEAYGREKQVQGWGRANGGHSSTAQETRCCQRSLRSDSKLRRPCSGNGPQPPVE